MNGLIDTFSNRLNTAMRIRNIKAIEISEKTGIDKSKISSYMSGRYKAKQDGVYLLAKALNVSEAWLMGLDVPMERTPDILQEKQSTKIPILGTVKAGYDYLAEENIVGYIKGYDAPDIENYYAVHVYGDSMEPVMSDGDIAIIHKQNDFENGNTCIVLINGDEATVKKVIKTDDGIDLIAANPYYPKRHFTEKEIKTIPVQIIGRVRESRKRNAFE